MVFGDLRAALAPGHRAPINPARGVPFPRFDVCDRFVVGRADVRATAHPLVEPLGELDCHGIINPARGGDHGWNPRVEQSLYLSLRGAAVEEDQL